MAYPVDVPLHAERRRTAVGEHPGQEEGQSGGPRAGQKTGQSKKVLGKGHPATPSMRHNGTLWDTRIALDQPQAHDPASRAGLLASAWNDVALQHDLAHDPAP